MKKKIISVFLLYFLQFLATSCCDCEPVKTFEKVYYQVEVKTWDTSGFQNIEVTDTAYKHSFGLTVGVEFVLNQIAFSKPKPLLSSFGFATAYATTCDCLEDEYITVDPIESILIFVTNTQTQEIINVTNNFSTYGYNGEQLPINELLQNKADWHDGFQLDMTEYQNIPDSSIFKVIILLESGTEMSEQTQQINFQ